MKVAESPRKILLPLFLCAVFSAFAQGQILRFDLIENVTVLNWIPVRQGGFWGYADTTRNIKITPQFDAAQPFKGKYAIIEKNKKAFAIDTTGKLLTPGFDQLVQLRDSVFFIYLNTVSDTLGGWGISTISGRLILLPAYDQVEELSPTLYSFRKGEAWGVVNMEGVIIVSPVYDSVYVFQRDFILLRKGKKFGLVSVNGNRLLPDEFVSIYLSDRNLFAALRKDKAASEDKPNGWGAVNESGALVVPFGQDTIIPVSFYFTSARPPGSDSLACFFPRAPGASTPAMYKSLSVINLFWIRLINYDGLCGVADSSGNMILPVEFKEIMLAGYGMWYVRDTNNRWGMFSAAGRELVRPSYTLIQPMRENVAIAFNSERKSLINRHGELLVPQGLHDILVRGKSVKVLRRDSSALYLRLDDNGRIVSQEEYDEFRVIKIGGREGSIAGNPAMTFAQLAAMPLFPIDSTDWFVLDNKWGLRNSFNGKVIIDPKYDFVIQGPRNIVKVGIRDTIPVMMIDDRQGYSGFRFGLVNDTSGKIILQPKYPQIYVEDFGWHGFYGFVRATLPDGKMALVSTDGSEQHMTYTWIDRPHEGYARFCIAGKWSIQTPGEMTHIVSSFSGEQNLLGELTFGRIYNAGNDFLQRPVYITGAKWGYLDSAGHIAVQPEYEAATRPAKATGLVRKDKKWGLIGMDAVVRIPCAYDGMAYLRVDTVVLVQAYMRNLRYGYLNQNGKIVISPTLKNSKPLGNGFLGFSRTGKWGIMNTNGLEICPETYHEILPFSEGFAAVRLGNRWGFIDTAGTEVIPAKYEKAGAFRNGMARVLLRQRWGFIDKENNLLVEAKFLQAGDFRGMSAPVKTIQGWGLVNRSGHFLLKAVWKAIVPLDSAGPAIFIIRNETASGLARSDGKIILSPIYNAYLWLGEGRIGYRSGLYWGMLDTTGRAVTQNIFDRIKPFGENYAAVSYEGKWGFINSNGKFVIRPSYKTAGIFNMNRAYVITQENRSCLIDTTGKIVMQFARGMGIAGYTEGKFLVHTYDRRNEINLMAYYNRHGSRIGRLEFKKATVFTDGAARVSPNGRTWGLISFTGFYLIKPRFAILDPFKNGLARFQLQTTQGLFRLDGSVMLPVAYDWISYNTDFRLIQIEHGNGLGYLYLNGAVCWPVAE